MSIENDEDDFDFGFNNKRKKVIRKINDSSDEENINSNCRDRINNKIKEVQKRTTELLNSSNNMNKIADLLFNDDEDDSYDKEKERYENCKPQYMDKIIQNNEERKKEINISKASLFEKRNDNNNEEQMRFVTKNYIKFKTKEKELINQLYGNNISKVDKRIEEDNKTYSYNNNIDLRLLENYSSDNIEENSHDKEKNKNISIINNQLDPINDINDKREENKDINKDNIKDSNSNLLNIKDSEEKDIKKREFMKQRYLERKKKNRKMS